MSIMIKLGRAIQDIRLKKGMTQEGLAFEVDLERTYISHVENGRRKISVVTLCQIAKGLGIKASTLLDHINQ
jgi:transcriptional regulator with XRE-family HTH domain